MGFYPDESNRGWSSYEEQYPRGMYLSNVFLWMFLGLMITFGVAIVGWMTNLSLRVLAGGGQLVLLVAQLAVVLLLSAMIERLSVGAARLCFLVYSALTGLTVSVYLYLFELSSLVFIFLVTSAFFGVFSLYGHLTRSDLSGARPYLICGLVVLLIYGVVTMFVPWLTMLDSIMTLGGVLLFLAYTAYDMQKVQRFYDYYRGDPEMLEKAAIFSALELYLDFINLFLRLLRYAGKRRK